jgi:hypothetical protein
MLKPDAVITWLIQQTHCFVYPTLCFLVYIVGVSFKCKVPFTIWPVRVFPHSDLPSFIFSSQLLFCLPAFLCWHVCIVRDVYTDSLSGSVFRSKHILVYSVLVNGTPYCLKWYIVFLCTLVLKPKRCSCITLFLISRSPAPLFRYRSCLNCPSSRSRFLQ